MFQMPRWSLPLRKPAFGRGILKGGSGLEYGSNRMIADKRRGFFVSGGTLPPDSASYLERSADKLLLNSLLAGRFCYVLNPRQLGKSSLSVHTMRRLGDLGVRTAFVDLTRIGGKNVTPEQWYSGLAMEIARGLNYRREAVAYWKDNAAAPPVQRLFGVISEVASLSSANGTSVVIFIDEIDATRSLPFDSDEFFAGIRECFNRRVSEPELEKLTFCLLGVAVPSDLIRNRGTTPFNIGERIILEDFTLDELSAFAPQLGPNGMEVIARVYYWTGGHPFLSQSLCRSIASENEPDAKTVDAVVYRELFEYKARDSNINLADVANIALHSAGDAREGEVDVEAFRANVLSQYQKVLAGKVALDDESNRAIVRLKLSGIVRSDGRRLYVRNRIYEYVFDRKWIEEHMPAQELRRQRQSFRRGVLRTALVTGTMLTVVGSVAAIAWRSRLEALHAEARLNYELYVSDMNSLRLYYSEGDTGRIEAILNRHRNSPYRGFEWGYWLGRYHDSAEEYTLDYKAPGKQMEGHISTDGKEICLVDDLTMTATIVKRGGNTILARSKIQRPDMVIATKSRWVEILPESNSGCRVMDLKLDRPITSIGDPGNLVHWATPVEHSDLVVTGEGEVRRQATRFINVWNIETGKKVFALRDSLEHPTHNVLDTWRPVCHVSGWAVRG